MPIPTEDPNDPRRRPPIGGGPVGVQTPMPPPQASTPIVDASQVRPPITGGPVGVQTPPTQPEPWVHPGNRRWREAKARGMSPEQFQQQNVTQVPNTATLAPAGTVLPPPKAPPVDVRGYPQAYPDSGQARLTAQRRYFRGGQGPTY